MTLTLIVQVICILLAGLLAGLFYGYQCSVIKGLGKLGNKEYLEAFQSINKAILNPYFFMSFLGSAIILPIGTVLVYKGGISSSFILLLAATIIYIVLVFGITNVGNVPLNNRLEKYDLPRATEADLQKMREAFEPKWNTLHNIRTYASILAFLLAILSLVC